MAVFGLHMICSCPSRAWIVPRVRSRALRALTASGNDLARSAPPRLRQDFFFALHDRGFLIFSKEANYENGAGGVEYGFVKVSPQFFLNDTLYYKTKSLPGE